jgi:hypothetical protein
LETEEFEGEMTADQFWQIIEASRAGSRGNKDAQVAALTTQLAELTPADVAEFERLFEEQANRAYHWDLWGAAYVIRGGCSDDSFADFRDWLISMGREVFERALQDADSLADLALGSNGDEETCFEELAYVAAQVYQEQTGEEMPDTDIKSPSQPAGEEWAEETAILAQRFPRLWAKYGWET